MARRERAFLERRAHGGGQLEEAQGVRDRRAILADPLGDVLLREPKSSRRCRYASASSSAVRSRRWTFSTSARRSWSRSATPSRTTTGTSARPARRAARHAALARDDPVTLSLARDEDGLEDSGLRDRAARARRAPRRRSAGGAACGSRRGASSGTVRTSAGLAPALRRRDEGGEAPAERRLLGIGGIVTAADVRPPGGRTARVSAPGGAGARARARGTPPRPASARRRGGSACRSDGRLGEPDVARHACLENAVAEVLPDLLEDLAGEVRRARPTWSRRRPRARGAGSGSPSRVRSSREARRPLRARSTRTGSGGGRPSAAASAFSVRSPSDGGQSTRTYSKRSCTSASRSARRNSRRSAPTSSTSAPTRSRFAGRRVEDGQLRRPRDLLERRPAEQPVVGRPRESPPCRRRGRRSRCPAGRGRRGGPAARAPPARRRG